MNVGNESVLEKSLGFGKRKNMMLVGQCCIGLKNLVVLVSPIERIIWSEEESKFDVPRGIYEIGLGMADQY